MNEVFGIHLLFKAEYIRLLGVEIADYGLDQVTLALNLVSARAYRCLGGCDGH